MQSNNLVVDTEVAEKVQQSEKKTKKKKKKKNEIVVSQDQDTALNESNKKKPSSVKQEPPKKHIKKIANDSSENEVSKEQAQQQIPAPEIQPVNDHAQQGKTRWRAFKSDLSHRFLLPLGIAITDKDKRNLETLKEQKSAQRASEQKEKTPDVIDMQESDANTNQKNQEKQKSKEEQKYKVAREEEKKKEPEKSMKANTNKQDDFVEVDLADTPGENVRKEKETAEKLRFKEDKKKAKQEEADAKQNIAKTEKDREKLRKQHEEKQPIEQPKEKETEQKRKGKEGREAQKAAEKQTKKAEKLKAKQEEEKRKDQEEADRKRIEEAKQIAEKQEQDRIAQEKANQKAKQKAKQEEDERKAKEVKDLAAKNDELRKLNEEREKRLAEEKEKKAKEREQTIEKGKGIINGILQRLLNEDLNEVNDNIQATAYINNKATPEELMSFQALKLDNTGINEAMSSGAKTLLDAANTQREKIKEENAKKEQANKPQDLIPQQKEEEKPKSVNPMTPEEQARHQKTKELELGGAIPGYDHYKDLENEILDLALNAEAAKRGNHDAFVKKLANLANDLRADLVKTKAKLDAKFDKEDAKQDPSDPVVRDYTSLNDTTAGKILDQAVGMLKRLQEQKTEQMTDEEYFESQKKIVLDFENNSKATPGWQKFLKAVGMVVFAAIGFIASVAIGMGIGIALTAWTGPGAFVGAAVGALTGAALFTNAMIGVTTGVVAGTVAAAALSGALMFKPWGLRKDAVNVAKAGNAFVDEAPYAPAVKTRC